jgi:hypothetical protein
MKFILTKTQFKKILLEEKTNNLVGKLETLKKFFKNVSSESKKQIGLDLEFLATWGVTIAGFVRPIAEFMKGNYPDLSNTELALLSTGIILTYFTSNKEDLKKVLIKIKEKSLIQEFDHMLSKASELKEYFISFVDSLAIPISKISNMMAYTFIIPIIPELYEYAQGYSSMEIEEMIKRVIGFVGITLSGSMIKNLLQEIVKRFKN